MTSDNKSVLSFNLSFMFHKKQLLSQMFEELLGWVQEGKIKVPPQTLFPLHQVSQAHKLIESGMSVGKLVLTTTEGAAGDEGRDRKRTGRTTDGGEDDERRALLDEKKKDD